MTTLINLRKLQAIKIIAIWKKQRKHIVHEELLQ